MRFGMAYFGAALLLPLYFQLARGESAPNAGLLIAPQGLGAALMMPFAGRATDRTGPGRPLRRRTEEHPPAHRSSLAC